MRISNFNVEVVTFFSQINFNLQQICITSSQKFTLNANICNLKFNNQYNPAGVQLV